MNNKEKLQEIITNFIGIYAPSECPEVVERLASYSDTGRITATVVGDIPVVKCTGADCPVYQECTLMRGE